MPVRRRRRRPPRRNGTGRHRASLNGAQLAVRGAAYTLLAALVAAGGYGVVAQERAFRDAGNRPPTVQPAPEPEPVPPLTTTAPPSQLTAEPTTSSAAPEPEAEPAAEPAPTTEPTAEAAPDPAPAATQPPPADTTCAISNSGGDVLPHVRPAACFLDDQFPGIREVGGRGPRELAGSDHPVGLAIDLFVGSNETLGDQIAVCAARRFADWNLDYIIWDQQILSAPDGEFRPMADRGSDTANHRDHVHLSFDPDPAHDPPRRLEC